mmetsp:Transcript_104330/g.185504  ORF Transcript_104330/g.185504 Transcript_104330/m.185504 type:complete len:591 (+) Transcript_104330:53-1825(+)
MTVTSEFVPGDFSPLGRSTSRAMKKIRSHVEEVDKELIAKANGEVAEKPEPPWLRQQELEGHQLLNSSLRTPKGKTLASFPSFPESDFSRTMKQKWLNSTLDTTASGSMLNLSFDDKASFLDESSSALGRSSAGGLETGTSSPSKSQHPTIAFTSLDHASTERVLDESARMLHKRFFHPVRSDEKPHLGHYYVKEELQKPRFADVELHERPKHLPIRPKEIDTGMEVGDPVPESTLGNPFHRSSNLSQIGLATERPDLAKITKIADSMMEVPDHYKDWCIMDKHSSRLLRLPDWDIQVHSQGHHLDLGGGFNQYFEPGKYKVDLGVVSPTVKVGMPFKKVMSRSQSETKATHDSPKAILSPSKKQLLPDRSMFRGSSLTVQRKTNIQHFEQDSNRPPLYTAPEVYYDESDPEVNAQVWEREMTFDASTADHWIIPRLRGDPLMQTTLARQNAGRGARIFQNDRGLRQSMGLGYIQTTVELESTVEASKEVPSRRREDVGRSFKQVQGRYRAPALIAKPVHSSLKQPKDGVTFDFARTAPAGFTTRAARLDRPLAARQRSHQALPTWDVEGYDEAEDLPLPTAPPLKLQEA